MYVKLTDKKVRLLRTWRKLKRKRKHTKIDIHGFRRVALHTRYFRNDTQCLLGFPTSLYWATTASLTALGETRFGTSGSETQSTVRESSLHNKKCMSSSRTRRASPSHKAQVKQEEEEAAEVQVKEPLLAQSEGGCLEIGLITG